MSALAFVCKPDSAEILTDSLALDVDSGRIADLGSKQVFVGTSGVIAMNGWSLPCDWFTALVSAHCVDFDGLVDRADDLWRMVTSAMLAQFPDDCYRCDPFGYVVALVGWSHARGRAEAYMLDSFTGGAVGPMTAFAMGGSEDYEGGAEFTRRFWRVPGEFDARRDGVGLLEDMRASNAPVGGFVQHSIVSESGIRNEIIHTWPDSVGELLEVA